MKKRIGSLLLAGALAVSAVAFGCTSDAYAASGLSNPTTATTTATYGTADHTATYSAVWFGEYPQTEIVDTASRSGVNGKSWASTDDYEVNAELYAQLSTATGWSTTNDITIDGTTYRRVSAAGVTYSASGDANYYDWTSTGYHYFRYDPIKWRVLSVNGSEAMLLADDVLDLQKYNATASSVTWENSSIRTWLNGTFLNTAFSTDEQSAIVAAAVLNSDNSEEGTTGGNATTDKVYLLSESESETVSYGYSSSAEITDYARRGEASAYAKAMGCKVSTNYIGSGNSYWMLRTPGSDATTYCDVDSQGGVDTEGYTVNGTDCGVRPVIKVTYTSEYVANAGTVTAAGASSTSNEIAYTGRVVPSHTHDYVATRTYTPEQVTVANVCSTCGDAEEEVVDTTVTTIAKANDGNWYNYVKGVVSTATTVAKRADNNTWWYVKGGKVDFTATTIAKNSSGWWYVKKGKVQFSTTSVEKRADNNTWWYVKKGKVTKYTGLVKRTENKTWWYVKNGQVQFSYTGLVKNSAGTWYVKKGQVQMSYSGKIKVGTTTYTIVNGKVK